MRRQVTLKAWPACFWAIGCEGAIIMSDNINVFILTQAPMPEPLLDRVRAASPRLRVTHRTARKLDELGDVWGEVEVLYTTGLLPAPEQAPRLRWVQGHFAGVDHVGDHPLVRPGAARPVTLTTTSGIHAPNMAEYVLMMMLAFAHRLPRMLEYQARAEWPEARWALFVPDELRGATLGVVGYGSLGREITRLAKALGMRVLAARRSAQASGDAGWRLPELPGEVEVDQLYPASGLRAMLPECDYVALVVPLTPETRHLIGADELRSMKRTAVLINVARGPVVDEAALIAALRAGVIGGAALDVFEQEPLPQDSPLWTLPNVVLSPHISGFTPHYDARAMALFAENLRRYAHGEALLNVVDVKKGY
jgi:phosphoglycerate dehydrogenase-like enzyme